MECLHMFGEAFVVFRFPQNGKTCRPEALLYFMPTTCLFFISATLGQKN